MKGLNMKNTVKAASKRWWLLVVLVAAVMVVFGGDLQAMAEAAGGGGHGGGHSAGLPQFNSAFFLTELFWLTVIFGTFYILVQGVAIPSVVRVLETRDGKIAHDISRAEELRNEAATINSVIEDKIIHARDHARTILSLANREAENVGTARMAMFDARISAQVRDGERRIGYARENALKELPAQVGDLVQDVVGRLGGTSVVSEQALAAVSATIKDRA